MVERFLEYVIENYRVNKEPANTLHAFLISLCWIGSELLKHKLDWKQSVALANEHLNFSCKEEEANSVYEKLEPAKEMFLLHSENHKKTDVSKDCNKEVAEETVEENEVQRNPETVAETSNLQTLDAVLNALSLQPNEEPSFPTVAEKRSNIPQALETTTEQVPNQAESNLKRGQSQRSDNQNQRASQTRNQSPDPLQFELEKFCELKNTINKFHEAIKLKLKSDHEKELEELIAQMNLKYEAKRQEAETAFQLKRKEIDIGFNRVLRNKILAETYRSKCNDLSPFDPSGTQAIKTGGMQHVPQFHMRLSSGVTSNSPAQSSGSHQVKDVQPPLQIVNQTAQLFSTTPNRSPSTMPYITVPTNTPSRLPSTTVLSSIPIRPPSTTITTPTPSGPPSIPIPNSTSSRPPSTTTTPNRPPPSTNFATDSPSRPPPSTTTTTPTSTPSCPPSTTIPGSTSNRPPYTTTTPNRPPPSTTTTNRPPPSITIHTDTPSRPPPCTISTDTSSRPPPSTTIPTDTPSRPPPSTTTPNSTSSRPPSTTTTPNRPPPYTAIPTDTPSRLPPYTTTPNSTSSRPPSTNAPTSTPNRPPPSTTIPTDTPSRPPPSTTTPNSTPIRPPSTTVPATTQISPPPGINPMTPSSRLISRPPSNINPIIPSSRSTTRPPPNMNPTTLLARNPRATAEIRTPAPHIRPFTPTTSLPHRPMSNNFPNFLQTSTQPPCPPSLQPPPSFPTNHKDHPTQNSPRSSPLSSYQPPSSVTVAPPLVPSLYSWLPSEQHPPPAMSSSLPPMPSISISNTGLYNASGGCESGTKLPSPSLLKLSALDMLMDVDKQAGLHRSDYFTSSSSDFLDLTELGQEAGGGNSVND